MRDNLRRSLIIAFAVGTMLVLINHGDHIEKEPICDYFFLKLGLCYCVPFSVSMVSGLLASRQSRYR
ncbi:MAG: nitrate/nitrite transporter NrtS [Proteobacteria bacterium]|nr:nitrate/nitrite transporter NrtS [Pseudomonadota bacterium]